MHWRRTFTALCGAFLITLAAPTVRAAAPPPGAPHIILEQTVQTLLQELTARRAELEQDKTKLFALVERVAVPLFDLRRIAKLVLAKHWRTATADQRAAFAEEFKKLLIGTYATALFQYTGDEKIIFKAADIRERGGQQFARVQSEITIGNKPPVAVEYALRQTLTAGESADWKIYNLTIAGLNMVVNYRNTYGASIARLGLDGLIESMRAANAKNFQ